MTTVFVLVNINDGFVYGVYTDEEKAFEHGNRLNCCAWDVVEREVK